MPGKAVSREAAFFITQKWQNASKPGKDKNMSKRQNLREQRQKETHMQRWMIIGGVVLIAVAIALVVILPNLPQPAGAVRMPAANPRPQASFNSMGDPNAPVKIIEYSDFQCPYCAQFWQETEAQLVETYVKTGKVYLTYRSMGNWVSNNINKTAGTDNRESEGAALAAYCAGDQNKFWEYHDILFANQRGENAGDFTRDRLEAFAQKAQLDMTTFKACLDSRKYAQQVTQDGIDGKNAILNAPNYDGSGYGTPSFLINGRLLPGAYPFADFQKEIEAALAAGQ
jgi:protein-disulfide isomerase